MAVTHLATVYISCNQLFADGNNTIAHDGFACPCYMHYTDSSGPTERSRSTDFSVRRV
jgi:hypothetical protein